MSYDDVVNIPLRTIYLTGTIEAEISAHVVRGILELSRKGRQSIALVINSHGGDTIESLAIYDALVTCGVPTIGIVMGQCSSAAATILQGCTTRHMSPNSRFMIHEGTVHVRANHPQEFLKATREELTVNSLHDKILAGRSRQSIKKIKQISKFAKFFSAQEAVEFGFADKIIKKIKRR